MYKGKPKPTGIFDTQTSIAPTKFTEKYHQGDIPCQIDLKGGEDEKPGGPPGGRALKWSTPIESLDLEFILPVFVDGLREKVEPQQFMAERGLEEILKGTKVKRLLKAIRSIIYPIKDNLRTLDDDICIKTLRAMQSIVRKSDKIAENFVQYFHILLPSVEVLKNKHKCAPKAPI